MKDCKDYKELLPLALYPDEGDQEVEKVLTHLKECPSCSREVEELKSMGNFIKRRKRPVMDEAYWDQLTDKIEDAIDREEEKKRGSLISLKKAFYPLTAAALIMIGISIGKYMPPSEVVPQSPPPLLFENQSHHLTPAVSRYFDSVTPLLLECSNYQQEGDISLNRKDIRSLLLENRILREIVAKQNNLTQKDLLEELEIILMELSNTNPQEAGKTIKDSGILMKMKSLNRGTTSL